MLNDPSVNENKAGIRVFPNLGRDAILVVPTVDDMRANTTPRTGYGHLLGFLRSAPEEKVVLPAVAILEYLYTHAIVLIFLMGTSPMHTHIYILQIMNLWKQVGETMQLRLESDAVDGKRVWLSTSGLGVPWLHVRLDSEPKYYTWTEYKERK